MTRPANVIVLDEPTNDLDSETLELLEEQLVEFGGTLLMVSHDRTFLNNVVTSTIVFEDGNVNEYVGGYDEWQAAVARRESAASAVETEKPKVKPVSKAASAPMAKRLSFNDQRALQQLPGKIEQLETEIANLHELMGQPSYYQQPADMITADAAKLKALEQCLVTTYARWEELES